VVSLSQVANAAIDSDVHLRVPRQGTEVPHGLDRLQGPRTKRVEPQGRGGQEGEGLRTIFKRKPDDKWGDKSLWAQRATA